MVDIEIAEETTELGGTVPMRLSSIESDTIGEILNISMGAGATAIATMLSKSVNITTPDVSIAKTEEIDLERLAPSVGIEIKYKEGLSGSNLLIMKRTDLHAMVNILLEGMGSEDSEEFGELQISAASELMNQMMGASSTALASFFGKNIDISTPEQFEPSEISERIKNSGHNEYVVSVKFLLNVEGILDSEFVTLMPIDFTKKLVENALNFGSEDESNPVEVQLVEQELEKRQAPQPPKQKPEPTPVKKKVISERNRQSSVTKKEAPVSVKRMELENFDDDIQDAYSENQDNFDLILNVPLDVSVVIGRTKMTVKNILDVRQGSIVELDRQAGEPVDVIVNGQLIAKGDVVIVDDNYGVRITEILTDRDISSRISE